MPLASDGDPLRSSHEHHSSTPRPAAAREDLEFLELRGVDFVEYDVEQDRDAYERMLELTGSNRTVPAIIEEGELIQVG